MRRVLGAVVVLTVMFIGWLAYETHKQDAARQIQEASVLKQLNASALAQEKSNSELVSKIDNIHFVFAALTSEIKNRVDRLELRLNHIKELSVSRSADRWTGKDAKSRNDLVDERGITVNRRLKEIEDAIEKTHKINL